MQKKTSAYQDQALPHIKVALDMKRLFNKSDGELVGHYIPFIIVKGSGNLSERAVHPSQFMSSQQSAEKLEIDKEWYKSNQLVNPLERLLTPIEGFLLDDVSMIFGLKKAQEVLVQDNDIDQKKVEDAKRELPLCYREMDLDLDDYVNQCYCIHYVPEDESPLDQNKRLKQCYGFRKCNYEEMFNFANKINNVVKNLLNKYGRPHYKC